MTINAKVPGTKFSLDMKLEGDDWSLFLMIAGTPEGSVPVKNLTLREITNSVEELLKDTQANVNPFQMELISKDLYRQTSGDEDMTSHEQRQKEIKDKIEKTESGEFTGHLVNEFKSQFKIKDDAPKMKQPKHKKMSAQQTSQLESNKERPEMQSMVSEINQNLGQRSNPSSSPQVSSNPAENLQRAGTQIDTRVSSVDIEDLIKELMETKKLLQEDINRVNQRMQKIDNIISKISSISSKL